MPRDINSGMEWVWESHALQWSIDRTQSQFDWNSDSEWTSSVSGEIVYMFCLQAHAKEKLCTPARNLSSLFKIVRIFFMDTFVCLWKHTICANNKIKSKECEMWCHNTLLYEFHFAITILNNPIHFVFEISGKVFSEGKSFIHCNGGRCRLIWKTHERHSTQQHSNHMLCNDGFVLVKLRVIAIHTPM